MKRLVVLWSVLMLLQSAHAVDLTQRRSSTQGGAICKMFVIQGEPTEPSRQGLFAALKREFERDSLKKPWLVQYQVGSTDKALFWADSGEFVDYGRFVSKGFVSRFRMRAQERKANGGWIGQFLWVTGKSIWRETSEPEGKVTVATPAFAGARVDSDLVPAHAQCRAGSDTSVTFLGEPSLTKTPARLEQFLLASEGGDLFLLVTRHPWGPRDSSFPIAWAFRDRSVDPTEESVRSNPVIVCACLPCRQKRFDKCFDYRPIE